MILTYFDLLPDSPIFRLRWQHCILDNQPCCGNFRISPGVTITKQPTCSSIFLAVDGRVAVRLSGSRIGYDVLLKDEVCVLEFSTLCCSYKRWGVLDATE